MIDTKNGWPAFPSTQYANGVSPTGHSPGMTLRDYFAAKAMQALISAQRNEDHTLNMEFRLSEGLSYSGATRGRIAVSAYAMADAMLKEREK